MLCMACGERMRLLRAVPDESMFVAGYEHHTLECPACRETEERLVFRHPDDAPPEIFVESAPAPAPPEPVAIVPATRMEPEPPVMPAAPEVPAAKKPPPGSRKKPPAPVARHQSSGAWERAIESLRSHQRDIAGRAQFSEQDTAGDLVPNPPPKLRRRRSAPLPSEQDAQARERFAEFWDDLIPHRPGSSPAAAEREKMKPLPRSVSLVVIEPRRCS